MSGAQNSHSHCRVQSNDASFFTVMLVMLLQVGSETVTWRERDTIRTLMIHFVLKGKQEEPSLCPKELEMSF